MFNNYDLQTVRTILGGIVPASQIYLNDGEQKNKFIDIEIEEGDIPIAAQALSSAHTVYSYDIHLNGDKSKIIIISQE